MSVPHCLRASSGTIAGPLVPFNSCESETLPRSCIMNNNTLAAILLSPFSVLLSSPSPPSLGHLILPVDQHKTSQRFLLMYLVAAKIRAGLSKSAISPNVQILAHSATNHRRQHLGKRYVFNPKIKKSFGVKIRAPGNFWKFLDLASNFCSKRAITSMGSEEINP